MSALPWWRTDTYDEDTAVPAAAYSSSAGPAGASRLVRAWKDGTTDPGWGLWRQDEGAESQGFMWKYKHAVFRTSPIVHGYSNGRWNFAFVMRSVRLVCIDIDGKNGGLEHAKQARDAAAHAGRDQQERRRLPPVLRHVRGRRGIHVKGYAQFADRIGLEQGVDLRATGCVYHHPQQRWNGREIVELPAHLKTRLTAPHAAGRGAHVLDREDDRGTGSGGDRIMHDALMDDLKKPIPAGRRNNTLFAIGDQMKMAQVPDWESQVYDRAIQLGLDDEEASKLVLNIRKYGDV